MLGTTYWSGQSYNLNYYKVKMACYHLPINSSLRCKTALTRQRRLNTNLCSIFFFRILITRETVRQNNEDPFIYDKSTYKTISLFIVQWCLSIDLLFNTIRIFY